MAVGRWRTIRKKTWRRVLAREGGVDGDRAKRESRGGERKCAQLREREEVCCR